MSNVFTLDSLREEVDKEYAPVKIGLSDGSSVTLRSLLRLNENDRKAVLSAVEAIGGDDADLNDVTKAATKVIDLLAGKDGKKLIRELDGDIALIVKVIESYMEASQLGEAQNSPA